MDLIDLKIEREGHGPRPSMCCESDEQYPYGLRLSFDQKVLEKLGIEKLPALEQMMKIVGAAKVVGVNESVSPDGKKYCHLELQMIAMKLEEGAPEKSKVATESKLYDKT